MDILDKDHQAHRIGAGCNNIELQNVCKETVGRENYRCNNGAGNENFANEALVENRLFRIARTLFEDAFFGLFEGHSEVLDTISHDVEPEELHCHEWHWHVSSNRKAEEGELYVSKVFVDEGVTMKRMRPAPQGRGYRIRKRSNHVTLFVDTKTNDEK